jgi:hypothetical protein
VTEQTNIPLGTTGYWDGDSWVRIKTPADIAADHRWGAGDYNRYDSSISWPLGRPQSRTWDMSRFDCLVFALLGPKIAARWMKWRH